VARLVLSDASPLIGLAIVQGIGRLADLFGEVWIPPQVRDEVLTGRMVRGESEIAVALAAGWLRIWSRG
jgi:predicted nucleic acid-binding protein